MEVENNSFKGQMIWSLKGENEDTGVQDAASEMTKRMNELITQGKTPQESTEIVLERSNEKKMMVILNYILLLRNILEMV